MSNFERPSLHPFGVYTRPQPDRHSGGDAGAMEVYAQTRLVLFGEDWLTR
mgnify:CR=1 FL=1